MGLLVLIRAVEARIAARHVGRLLGAEVTFLADITNCVLLCRSRRLVVVHPEVCYTQCWCLRSRRSPCLRVLLDGAAERAPCLTVEAGHAVTGWGRLCMHLASLACS